jgi:hypothetical protein
LIAAILSAASDAPVITDTDEAHVLCLWREKRVHIDLEDVSNYRWYAANTGQEPLGSNIGALLFETVVFCWGGCSGTFLSCFAPGARINTYA